MEVQDSHISKRGPLSSTSHYVLMGLGGVALVIITAITSTTLHRLPASPQTPKLTLRERFPGFFRTAAEQQVFEAELDKWTATSEVVKINVTNVCDTRNCSLGFPNKSNYEPLTPAREIRYTACCIANSSYIFPPYMVDVTGINRTISSFDGNRQYFFTETCSQVDNCKYCTCSISNYTVTAVYDDGPDDYKVGFFKLIGCCRCIN